MKSLKVFAVLLLLFAASMAHAVRNVGEILVWEPSDVSRSVAYTATAGSTATWNAGPGVVLVYCTSDCYVRVGVGVTATTTDTVVPANTPIWMPVPVGTAAWRVSAVQVNAGGTVYATPFN